MERLNPSWEVNIYTCLPRLYAGFGQHVGCLNFSKDKPWLKNLCTFKGKLQDFYCTPERTRHPVRSKAVKSGLSKLPIP